MHRFFWTIAIAGGAAGAVLFIASLALSGDMAEATVRAVQALCCVVIPYVVARAIDELA
jgi:signal recognition particle receptor subunit beta